VTVVIAGWLGADALSVSENKAQPFPTLAVGNAEMDSPDWFLGDLLSLDEEAGTTPGNSGRIHRRRGSRLSFRPLSTRRPERRQALRTRTRSAPDPGPDSTTAHREI